MINLIWGGTIAFLILFVTFWTPVKAPMHVQVEVLNVDVPVKQSAPTAPVVEPRAEAKPDEVKIVQAASSEELIGKGKRLYIANCISCHNKDPNVKGSIGPELMDAPLELMRVKVVTGRYPEVLPAGFVPKRKTKIMTKFPKLGADVDAIHAYVQSLKQ